MKFFIALIASTLFSSAFAATTIQKTFDGGNAVCEIKADVGSRAYRLNIVDEVIKGDKREVTLAVKFFKCAQTDAGLRLVKSSADEVLDSYIVLSSGALGTAQSTLASALFIAVDDSGTVLASQNVTQSGSEMTVKLSIAKDQPTAFILADLVSNVDSVYGSIAGLSKRYGGFVLHFSK